MRITAYGFWARIYEDPEAWERYHAANPDGNDDGYDPHEDDWKR